MKYIDATDLWLLGVAALDALLLIPLALSGLARSRHPRRTPTSCEDTPGWGDQ